MLWYKYSSDLLAISPITLASIQISSTSLHADNIMDGLDIEMADRSSSQTSDDDDQSISEAERFENDCPILYKHPVAEAGKSQRDLGTSEHHHYPFFLRLLSAFASTIVPDEASVMTCAAQPEFAFNNEDLSTASTNQRSKQIPDFALLQIFRDPTKQTRLAMFLEVKPMRRDQPLSDSAQYSKPSREKYIEDFKSKHMLQISEQARHAFRLYGMPSIRMIFTLGGLFCLFEFVAAPEGDIDEYALADDRIPYLWRLDDRLLPRPRAIHFMHRIVDHNNSLHPHFRDALYRSMLGPCKHLTYIPSGLTTPRTRPSSRNQTKGMQAVNDAVRRAKQWTEDAQMQDDTEQSDGTSTSDDSEYIDYNESESDFDPQRGIRGRRAEAVEMDSNDGRSSTAEIETRRDATGGKGVAKTYGRTRRRLPESLDSAQAEEMGLPSAEGGNTAVKQDYGRTRRRIPSSLEPGSHPYEVGQSSSSKDPSGEDRDSEWPTPDNPGGVTFRRGRGA
ncbi:hypothetical protein BV25DRAFT_1231534 [Artomyces pyxidatus]|uniref:Uncharacterized protein n=1 Tax=Artomyces pyxidatus TaxID=48021 RepID=A0ACB8SS04_9AGAM|nr:hypothetical protein BV25DRAFT_1231534 [Artomyces pyxidatus]